MRQRTCFKRTFFWFLTYVPFAFGAQYGSVEFHAEVDQDRISLDDAVTLHLIIKSDNDDDIGTPTYSAPDFTLDHESNQMSVEYQSGLSGFSVKKTQELIKVLRPLKKGDLVISKLALAANDKSLRVGNITVHVGSSVGGGAPNSPRMAKPPQATVGTQVLLRAEVDKPKVYKGEQVIVSYTLLYQMKVFNLQVDKFPILSGFLREDLDMPIMGQRLSSQEVVLGGVPYHASLLARYAAYPLQEGTLDVDSMALKFNYYSSGYDNGFNEEDPFFSFFQHLAPKVGTKESEKIHVQVIPLPEDGKPNSFGGGVGKFKVSASLSRGTVRANEAVSLIVKVEGRGNLASIHEPKPAWPAELELYDTKVQSQKSKIGNEQKTFEFLLIPRVPGKVEIPSLEMGFFDPEINSYYLQKTEPIELTVTDPAPGSPLVAKRPTAHPQDPQKKEETSGFSAQSNPPGLRPLKPLDNEEQLPKSPIPIWRILYWACILCFIFLVATVILDLIQGKTRSRHSNKSSGRDIDVKWEELFKLAKQSDSTPWPEFLKNTELLLQRVLSSLEKIFDQETETFTRILTRDQIRQVLVEEQGVSNDLWAKLLLLLEFTDAVRFAATGGGQAEKDMRREFSHFVSEGRSILKAIQALKLETE